ncbi:hypothetical protein HUS23_06435 [Ectothiorhodospiraceae bacterium 2226]|nr:hypothetical protein HUS23_06435 [Ectothiorhodospiraceae bacterium 2226]
MAPWLIPALKVVLPHVGTIISAAAPAFTKRGADASVPPPQLVQQQIAELQAAASQNAAHVKELAAQLQRTVAALEQAAELAQARMRRTLVLAAGAAGVSVISAGFALLALLGN